MAETRCIVCRDRARRPAIDAALTGGSVLDDVAERFKITRESLRRHARNHLGLSSRVARREAREALAASSSVAPTPTKRPTAPGTIASAPSPDPAPIAVEPDELLDLDTPASTFREIVKRYCRAVAAERRARLRGDHRYELQWHQAGGTELERIAKSLRMYSDGVTVTANVTSIRVQIGKLSAEALDDLLSRDDAALSEFLGILSGEAGEPRETLILPSGAAQERNSGSSATKEPSIAESAATVQETLKADG